MLGHEIALKKSSERVFGALRPLQGAQRGGVTPVTSKKTGLNFFLNEIRAPTTLTRNTP
jgi:hypothetical protein